MRKPALFGLSLLLAASFWAADTKLRLGDLPDPEEKNRSMDEDPHPKEIMEEKFQAELHKNIAETFYMKGKQALDAGNKEGAEGYFDRALILVPDHARARAGLAEILKSYDPPAASTTVAHAADPVVEENPVNVKKSKESAVAKKEKVEKLYIEALAASQNGQSELAISLCQQALELDPSHQPAKRMLTRLIPKPVSTATPIQP